VRKIWVAFTATCFVAALGACLGRTPQPVAVIQPQDQLMDCTAIYAEVTYNNQKVEQLGRDEGWKVAQNVAAGVAGFVVPVLWFGMDWQGTASKEAQALQARQQYLGALAVQKHCGSAFPKAAQSR
jgi:hypothetical protein